MALQTLSPICLLDIGIQTIPCHTEDLVVILRFSPLQCCLCLFQFRLQSTDVGIGRAALHLGLLNRGFEIGDGDIIFFEVEVNAGMGRESFEGVLGGHEGGVCIGESFLAFKL